LAKAKKAPKKSTAPKDEYKERKFNKEGWSCSRKELIAEIESARDIPLDLKDPKVVEYFFELKFHMLEKELGKSKSHIEQVMTLAGAFVKKKRGRKKVQASRTATYHELMDLPDWRPLEGGVMIGVKKQFQGKMKNYTIYVDQTGYRVLEKAAFVPPDTQPNHGFEVSTTAEWDEVFMGLVSLFKEYIYFNEDDMYSMLACCAMSTYFREVFDTYPYCDFYAAELECGKTTAMKCLIWSSFHGFMPLDPTGPVMFRAIDSCKSAIGIDEVDNLLKDPESQSRFLGLFNASYQKGLVAYRIDMKQEGMPIAYDPFGLKAFTHVAAIPESIQSRSITFSLIRSPLKLPLVRNADTFSRPRDQLYKLRLVASEEVEATYKWVLDFIELANRPKDLFSPPLTMAKLISEELFNSMYKWARKYVEEHAGQQLDEVKRTLIEVLLGYSGDVKVKVIAAGLSDLCHERGLTKAGKDGGQYYFHSRTVIRMLASFGMHKTPKRTDGNIHIRVIASRVRDWAKVYKIDVDDEIYEATPASMLVSKNGEAGLKIEKEQTEESDQNDLARNGEENEESAIVYPRTSFSSLSSEQPSRQTELVKSVDQSLSGEASPKIESNSLDNGLELNEDNEVSGYTIAHFNPDAFINPADGQIPDILKKLVRWWKTKKKPFKDGIKPDKENPIRDLDLLMKGLESGYVQELMPSGFWFLTDTAKEEIERWRL